MADRAGRYVVARAALLGVLAAAVAMAACYLVGLVLARQVLVGGLSVDWSAPALATSLAVLGSLGPVGFLYESDEGLIGLGVEAGAFPWVLALNVPMLIAARLRAGTVAVSPATAVVFAIAYGITFGIGVGAGSIWAVSLEPGLELPVSPDLVAGRMALAALVALALLNGATVIGSLHHVVKPAVVGALVTVGTAVVLWLVGLGATLASNSTVPEQPLATASAVVGGNLTTAGWLESTGAETNLTVGSGLTGATESFSLADVVAWPDWLSAILGSALVIVVAWMAALVVWRRTTAHRLAVWLVLGVAVGVAGAGAMLAAIIDGGLDLLVLPIDPSQRSFSEVRLAVSVPDVFTGFGSRALFGLAPLLWFLRDPVDPEQPQEDRSGQIDPESGDEDDSSELPDSTPSTEASLT